MHYTYLLISIYIPNKNRIVYLYYKVEIMMSICSNSKKIITFKANESDLRSTLGLYFSLNV